MVAGLIPLVLMSKCPWERYWKLNCSWCHLAWQPPPSVHVCMYAWITLSYLGQKHLLNVNKTHCLLPVCYWYYYTIIRLNMTIFTPGPIYVLTCMYLCICIRMYTHVCMSMSICIFALSLFFSLFLFTSFTLPATQTSYSLLHTLVHNSSTHTNT